MLQYFVAICHSQGRKNNGWAGEAVKELRAMETYKIQKIVANILVSVQQ